RRRPPRASSHSAWQIAAMAPRATSASSPSSITPPSGATSATPPPSSAPSPSPTRSTPHSTPHAARLADMPAPGPVPLWQPSAGLLMRSSARDSNDRRRRSAALPLQRAAPMTRFVPVTVLVLLAVLASGRIATAQEMPTGPLGSGAQIVFSELKIHENNNPALG